MNHPFRGPGTTLCRWTGKSLWSLGEEKLNWTRTVRVQSIVGLLPSLSIHKSRFSNFKNDGASTLSSSHRRHKFLTGESCAQVYPPDTSVTRGCSLANRPGGSGKLANTKSEKMSPLRERMPRRASSTTRGTLIPLFQRCAISQPQTPKHPNTQTHTPHTPSISPQ